MVVLKTPSPTGFKSSIFKSKSAITIILGEYWKLLNSAELQTIWQLRKAMSNFSVADVTERLIDGLVKTKI